jgi:hypothetical protein
VHNTRIRQPPVRAFISKLNAKAVREQVFANSKHNSRLSLNRSLAALEVFDPMNKPLEPLPTQPHLAILTIQYDEEETMSTVAGDHIRDGVLALLAEAYPGTDPDECWFTWGGPDSGVIGTLESLSAEQASTPAHEGGTTIAAIAAHLRFTLQYGNVMWSGKKPEMSWDDSWPITTVNEAEWTALCNDIRSEYALSVKLLEIFQDWSHPKAIAGSFGHIAHTAYHLGAIRQIMKQVVG